MDPKRPPQQAMMNPMITLCFALEAIAAPMNATSIIRPISSMTSCAATILLTLPLGTMPRLLIALAIDGTARRPLGQSDRHSKSTTGRPYHRYGEPVAIGIDMRQAQCIPVRDYATGYKKLSRIGRPDA